MNAGRELDALIAEKVMGLSVIPQWPCGWMPDGDGYEAASPKFTSSDYRTLAEPFSPSTEFTDSLFQELSPVYRESQLRVRPVPFYGTSIEAAWQVVEKLKLGGYQFSVGTDPDVKPWFAQCWNTGTTCNQGHSHIQTVQEFADTAPLAICLAALKAVGYKEEI